MPAWIPCDCCEEFWCTIHGMHAFECPCPPIDEWETDPYATMPYCPRCTAYKHLPADQCECSLISTEIHPTPDPEPAPQVSDDMLQLLCLMASGEGREFAEAAFGGGRLGELRVRAMLAFLGHRHRQYVAGWRITERGKQLLSRS